MNVPKAVYERLMAASSKGRFWIKISNRAIVLIRSNRRGIVVATHDEMLDKVTRVRRAWRDERGALATVRRFNAKLSAKSPWLVILCDSCGAVTDLDLRVKPRNGGLSFAICRF